MAQFIHLFAALILFSSVHVMHSEEVEIADDDFNVKMRKDPLYKQLVEEGMEKPWTEYKNKLEKEKKKNPHWRDHYSSDLIEVPVVVHIIYKTDEFIIGNEQIQSSFRILNDAYFDINYWNKTIVEQYNNISANFSMQFKLSQIKYINATGQGPAHEWGWTQDEVVQLSPNFDQRRYLHFYLVKRIYRDPGNTPGKTMTTLGRSSFPRPKINISQCFAAYGFPNGITDGDECLQINMFAPLFEAIVAMNNGANCIEIQPQDDDTGVFWNETACLNSFNTVVAELSTQYNFNFAELYEYNGDTCIKFYNSVCLQFKDPTQVITFASKYFQTEEDDKRGAFDDGYGWIYRSAMLVPHEVGHWTGLLHIFGYDYCESGDQVDDTLSQYAQSSGCPADLEEEPRSCNSSDMYNNWMDYSKCLQLKYMFTEGQVERGRFYFETESQLRNGFMKYRANIVTKFINSIYFIIEQEYVSNNPCHSGDIWIEQDINIGNKNNKIIYMCATYTMNPLVYKITELKFTNISFRDGYLDCGGQEWEKNDINLNYGNNGDEIYLCYKKEKYGSYSAKPITNINILVTNMKYRQNELRSEDNWNVLTQNLNENSGSEQFVYLVYNTKPKSKNDVFSAGVKPIILEKNFGWDNVEKHNINHIDNEDKVVISQRKYLRSKHHEEHLFSYDKLIYFFGLSSGISICAICLILIGVVYYMKNHTFEIYDKVKQNESDNEQV
eukprot:387052_1